MPVAGEAVAGEVGYFASFAAGLLVTQALVDLAATAAGGVLGVLTAGLGVLSACLGVLLVAQALEDDRSMENLLDNSRTCSSLMN